MTRDATRPRHAPPAAAGAAVELRHGGLRLALRPDLGGSIAGLWHDGTPVLRSVEPAALAGPRQSACFPLVPYSNRLAHRRFHWLGREHTTAANFDASPHSLHGVGWHRPWQLVQQQADSAVLRYRHTPDDGWPFAFEAEQSIVLAARSLRLGLRLLNTAAHDAPAGLGWHPYFPKRGGSRLRIDVDTRWENDDLQLPSHAVAQAPIDGAVASLAVDHCFSGWRGAARIDDECFSLRLSSTLSHVVVFTPPAQAHYCVEPVSHVNDAIHAADPQARGWVRLRPGESVAASMTLDIAEAHAAST